MGPGPQPGHRAPLSPESWSRTPQPVLPPPRHLLSPGSIASERTVGYERVARPPSTRVSLSGVSVSRSRTPPPCLSPLPAPVCFPFPDCLASIRSLLGSSGPCILSPSLWRHHLCHFLSPSLCSPGGPLCPGLAWQAQVSPRQGTWSRVGPSYPPQSGHGRAGQSPVMTCPAPLQECPRERPRTRGTGVGPRPAQPWEGVGPEDCVALPA